MTLKEALCEAQKFEQACLTVVKAENEKWKVSDEELGRLRYSGDEFDSRLSGMLANSYLNELIEAGLVENNDVEISELPAISNPFLLSKSQ